MSNEEPEVKLSFGRTLDSGEINPSHYKDSCSLECIQAMRIAYGNLIVCHFCICNAFKYIWRYKNKNGEIDLKKGEWYLNYARSLYHRNNFDENTGYYIERLNDIYSEVIHNA